METLIIYPENKEQLRALKALARAWKIKAEMSPYDRNFVKTIKKAEKRGSYKDVDPSNLWKDLGRKQG